jgi:cell division transport system ATP-binding protein
MSISPPVFTFRSVNVLADAATRSSGNSSTSILTNISTVIHPEETVLLTGNTGTGKTTFLRLLYGAILPTQGSVSIGGVTTQEMSSKARMLLRRSYGIAFQDCKLLPNRTIVDNIVYPLMIIGKDYTEAKKEACTLLEQFTCKHLQDLLPRDISGGEGHIVTFIRAVLHRPSVLILDEPTADLDAERTDVIADILRERFRTNTTVFAVTHNEKLSSMFGGDRHFHFANGTMTEQTVA